MQKKVLSEIALYYGDIDMPKDWDIDREKIEKDILSQTLFRKEFPFSKYQETDRRPRDFIDIRPRERTPRRRPVDRNITPDSPNEYTNG